VSEPGRTDSRIVDAAAPRDAATRVAGIADGPRVTQVDGPAEDEPCDHCGAHALAWRKCKLICANCAHINKSCADL
jgi:hypothetical protein